MPFTVHGLSPEPFLLLYGLNDEELRAHRARRMIVDGAGYPERVELRDAEPGETLLLVNHEHQSADTPYRSSHAIYVREGATQARSCDGLPEVLRRRLLSLRGFSAEGMMIDADVCDGSDAEALIERLLGDERVAYLHAHAARPGCYLARINRA